MEEEEEDKEDRVPRVPSERESIGLGQADMVTFVDKEDGPPWAGLSLSSKYKIFLSTTYLVSGGVSCITPSAPVMAR